MKVLKSNIWFHNNLQIIINYSSPQTSSNMIVYQSYVISLNTKMDCKQISSYFSFFIFFFFSLNITVYQSSAVVLYGKCVCNKQTKKKKELLKAHKIKKWIVKTDFRELF